MHLQRCVPYSRNILGNCNVSFDTSKITRALKHEWRREWRGIISLSDTSNICQLNNNVVRRRVNEERSEMRKCASIASHGEIMPLFAIIDVLSLTGSPLHHN